MQQPHAAHFASPHSPHPSDGMPSAQHSTSNNRQHRATHHIQPSSTAPTTPNDATTHTVSMVGPSHPMPRQRVYFGPYLLLQTLGEGEFGKVKLGVHSSPERWGEEVAIKLIKRGNVDTQARMIKVAREIDVLKLVKHPNIVRLYDVIETEKYIGIVLEYASGGELFDHILAHRYLKEKDASKLFAQLISGVTYLHNKKIVHRDLKLENLLLDRNRNIIITDFGFANRFQDRTNDLMATSCGSPCYAAPELVVQDGRYVGSQVDVWSCGVILYAMLAGYLPFDDDPSNPDGDNINLLYKYIINTPLSFPEWITDEPKDLLLKMLVPDPLKRCSLRDVINHPWLTKYQHLFHRSLEELERISEENEQNKRLMLQRQRQMMAASSNKSTGVDVNRSLSTANATGPASHKSRGHQSAMVVPTTNSFATHDAPQSPHTPPGAYQQQQRQQVHPAPITHLQSNPHPPTGIPVPSNRRHQQAQSAFVVPNSVHSHEDESTATHHTDTQPYSNALPRGTPNNKMLLDEDGKANNNLSASAGKKRKVATGATPNVTPSPAAQTVHSNLQQRYTVQVEYSGAPGRDDPKGKGRRIEVQSPQQKQSLPVAGSDGIVDDDVVLTPTMPTSEDVCGTPTARLDDQHNKSTPQPNRAFHSTTTPDTVIPTVQNTDADLNESNGNVNGAPKETAAQSVPFPSPDLSKPPAINGIDRLPVGTKANPSQVSFGTTSQASGRMSAGPKPNAAKSEARHRKGLSTDRFLSRFLGGSSMNSGTNVSQTTTAPPLPSAQPTRKATGNTSSTPSVVKTARRKAMSMVVEPWSGKISSTPAARANRKSAKVTPAPEPRTPIAEDSKRRARGTSVMASPGPVNNYVGTDDSHVGPTSIPPKRRITLTSSQRRAEEKVKSATSPTNPSHTNPHVVVSSQSARADSSIASSVGVNEDEDRRQRERQSGSPNWSHHTAATSAHSTGQVSSSSKAKKVMDWFRFKSLNSSSATAHQTQPSQVSDHLTPPTPIQTDFDQRKQKHPSQATKSSGPSSSTLNSGVIVNLPAASNTDRPPIPGGSTHLLPSNQMVTAGPSIAPMASSTKANHRYTLAHPRPNTATAATFNTQDPASTSGSGPVVDFNDSKLKLHHGAIDQNAITSKPPPVIMAHLKQILWELGIDVAEENPMKLKATRRSKKKVVANLGMGVFEALQSQQQGGSGLKGMFQRKSSVGSQQIGILIDQFGQVTTGDVGASQSVNETSNAVQPLPAYADDPSIDSGDDVRFTVEVTKLRGLVGLYAVDIKRLKGSLWSFKYLYLQILERAELGKRS